MEEIWEGLVLIQYEQVINVYTTTMIKPGITTRVLTKYVQHPVVFALPAAFPSRSLQLSHYLEIKLIPRPKPAIRLAREKCDAAMAHYFEIGGDLNSLVKSATSASSS